MKKNVIAAIMLTAFGASTYAQDTNYEKHQKYLEQGNERLSKKQLLIGAQAGHKFGLTYSSTIYSSWHHDYYTKGYGVLFTYGNRLSEHWMLGAMTGVDVLNEKNGDLRYSEKTSISLPIMAEARFYIGTSRVMPYIFTNIGWSLSGYGNENIFNIGIGADINFKDSHTIFISVGTGINYNELIRLGYYF